MVNPCPPKAKVTRSNRVGCAKARATSRTREQTGFTVVSPQLLRQPHNTDDPGRTNRRRKAHERAT
jgi:hypothetical protein